MEKDRMLDDRHWQNYFRKHFPDLERKYPGKETKKRERFFARLLKSFREKAKQWQRPLCQDCKYNDPRYCPHPERPFATECRDFKDKRQE